LTLKKTPLLGVRKLAVEFYPGASDRFFRAVVDASFEIAEGEILGLVGESGCGKSATALALLDLLPETARPVGEFLFGEQKYIFEEKQQRKLRGQQMGMVFQEPLTALNPLYSVGAQIYETLTHLRGIKDKNVLRSESVDLLERVHLDNPVAKLESYPHQLSGGQRQRVMIALALAGEPRLLIADEPTTALDASLQRGIMELFSELAASGLGVLLISHDLDLVAEVAGSIAVMYSGYTVETGTTKNIIKNPLHPYTRGLLDSSKAVFSRQARLPVIKGEVPDPSRRPPGCPFSPRCREAFARCTENFPPRKIIEKRQIACWARSD
jgi:oligopeptide/dipeptide ABC transporter ATP-binding protein